MSGRGWWLAGGLAAIAACGSGDDVVPVSPWPEARIDVEVRALGLHVTAIVVDHPDVCSQQPFLASGCDQTSDAIACSGNPASWIEHVELYAGSRSIGRVNWDEQSGGRGVGLAFGEYAGRDDLRLAIYTIDAGHTDVRLPDTALPAAPTLGPVTWDGTSAHVTWSAPADAGSGLIAISNGFVGQRCRVEPGAPVDFAWPAELQPPPPDDPAQVYAIAHAPAVVDTNALGSVTMWLTSDSAVAAVPRE